MEARKHAGELRFRIGVAIAAVVFEDREVVAGVGAHDEDRMVVGAVRNRPAVKGRVGTGWILCSSTAETTGVNPDDHRIAIENLRLDLLR